MTLKAISAIASAGESDAPLLRETAAIAAAFGARAEIIPAFADPAAELVYYGAVLNRALDHSVLERIQAAEKDALAKIETAARRAAAAAGVAWADGAGAAFALDQRDINPRAAISRAAVLSDLTLIAAAAVRRGGELADAFAAALLGDWAPILLVRGEAPVLGAPAAIAWDASPQAGRALRAALPLLTRAPSITLIQHAAGMTEAQAAAADPARVARYLARHAAPAPRLVAVEGAREGEAILGAAIEAGAGLLVAGGFGRSRFSELVLGGATRAFVEAAAGPHLLLSH
ncbi:MAG: hypothetical protein AB7L65_11305 [Hyphomonadaceae bacterium]